jgi:response regulator RpfG family c-di-GMP phosphodiesterase
MSIVSAARQSSLEVRTEESSEERPTVLLGIDGSSVQGNEIENALRARCGTHVLQSFGDALAVVNERRYDAIIVDERAFDGHGVDLLAMVASSSPATFRLLVARAPDSCLLKRAIHEAGVHRVFFDPLSPSRIARAVDELCRPAEKPQS